MKTTHTKGKWIAEQRINQFEVDILANNKRVCAVKSYRGKNFNDPTEKEADANAKLIAAAPDLLEVCESIEEVYSELMASDSPKLPIRKFEYLSKLVSKSREAVKKAKAYDTKPILKLFGPHIQEVLKDDLPEKTPTVEYLSKIQNDQKALGERLKAVRIANGIELKDIANRDDAEHLENGRFIDQGGQLISTRYLFQYAHEIGAGLSCHNVTETVCEHERTKGVDGLYFCGNCGIPMR